MQNIDENTPQPQTISPTDNSLDDSENQDQPNDNRLSLLHIITSVLAAAIGVQSKKNQQKDFTNKQSIYIYIAAGIIFTTTFVFTVIYVVKTVLSNAGA